MRSLRLKQPAKRWLKKRLTRMEPGE